MTIYADLNDAGLPVAFYNDAIHRERDIPDGLLEISEAQWADCLAHPSARRWDAASSSFVAYAPPAPPLDLVAYAAQARWQREIAGVVLNGDTIPTDEQSQSKITGTYALSQADPSVTLDFKSSTGWVTLNADQIKGMALAVARHVQACFSTERAVAADIAAGKITTAAEVDAAFAAVP